MAESSTNREKVVAVVDPDRRAYLGLEGLIRNTRAAILWLSRGREALRLEEEIRPRLWLIGMDLPDLPCFDLLEMLRQRHDHSQFCIVAGSYRKEDEQRAYRAGRTAYACKPLEAWWLRELVRSAVPSLRHAPHHKLRNVMPGRDARPRPPPPGPGS